MAKIIKTGQASPSNLARYERAVLEVYMAPPSAEEDSSEEPDHGPAIEEIRARLEAENAEAMAQLRADAEEQVRQAYDEGMRRGVEAGKAQFLESVASAEQALQGVAGEISKSREAIAQQAQDSITSLIQAIVSRILKREAWADPHAIQRVLQDILEHLSDKERLVLHMNPRDVETLNREAVGFLDSFDGVRHKEIIPDEAIEPGGCTVESATMFVDAQLDAQLNRILESISEIAVEPPEPE